MRTLDKVLRRIKYDIIIKNLRVIRLWYRTLFLVYIGEHTKSWNNEIRDFKISVSGSFRMNVQIREI